MNKYELTVTVTYTYEVEAETEHEAEHQGFDYEDYKYTAEVDSIEVADLGALCEECNEPTGSDSVVCDDCSEEEEVA